MKRPFILLLACLLVVLTMSASAAPAKRADACTWGASSVVVEQVNGQYVQSEPATTGCILSSRGRRRALPGLARTAVPKDRGENHRGREAAGFSDVYWACT